MSTPNNVITKPAGKGYARLLLGSVAADNAVLVTARAFGTGGNDLSVKLTAAGNNTPLSVSVVGDAIDVALSTDGTAASTAKASEVAAAINDHAAASELVFASAVVEDSDGTGVVAAKAKTNLADGDDDARVVSVDTDTVVTDPNASNAVQVPAEADATGRNALAVHGESTPY